MIYIPIFSLFTVPFNSLANELTPDYEERTSIMTYRSAMQKVFEVANFYALKFTNLAWFLIPGTGKQNVLRGYAGIYLYPRCRNGNFRHNNLFPG